jgi:NTE family protein
MTASQPRLSLALAGGAARGLAHVGVLAVLEREHIRADFIAGTSMGGLIGALSAVGLDASAIERLARGFHFPRRFVPGGLLDWSQIFPTAVPVLRGWDFERLSTELAMTAVDLERGRQVILHEGSVLAAVRATCAVPGVMPPEKIDGRWLVDGGLVNILPVDLACAACADIVLAVKPKAGHRHRMRYLDSHGASLLSRVGRLVPNPATAKLSFEVLVRAAEIALETTATFASSMTGPDLLIEPDIDDIGMRDFGRAAEAIAAGRRATEGILPALRTLLALPPRAAVDRTDRLAVVHFDPVCGMAIGAARAASSACFDGTTYYFCSTNCCDRFAAAPPRYVNTRTNRVMHPES